MRERRLNFFFSLFDRDVCMHNAHSEETGERGKERKIRIGGREGRGSRF